MIIVPVAITVTGIILFGFAVQNQMHWAVIFTAYGMTSVALTASPGIAMTYVSDNYFPVAAECLEMINGIKNVVAFGFIEATVPWVQEQGFVKVSEALAIRTSWVLVRLTRDCTDLWYPRCLAFRCHVCCYPALLLGEADPTLHKLALAADQLGHGVTMHVHASGSGRYSPG
jgi:hypothetical protein